MKAFQKNYIGKGTKVENLDIVSVTISMEDAEQFTFEYDGKKFLKFEIAKMLQSDKYGKTHTAYVQSLVDDNSFPEPKKAKAKSKK
jgi:hypothetical protein